MAAAVTFAGVGSGIDVESLVSGLTSIARQPISQEKSKAASLRAAQSTISDVGSLLSKLKLSVNALSTAQQATTYKASATGTSLAVSATGSAQGGAYDVTVSKLAKEQRTYSNALSANALGFSGNLDLTVGSTSKQIAVTGTDTLNTIADKINGAGLRASASVIYDGTNYRLQVRGLDTGSANAMTFGAVGGVGDQLGLRTAANTKQQAQNAELTVDGFAITSTTNQVSGAIPGVTLALKEEGGPTSKVTVETDPTALGDKLQAVVDAYNAVVKSVQKAAGTSKSAASNPALAGNSALRGVTTKLSSALTTTFGDGKFNLLGSVGVNLQNDGTLLLNRTKLATALEQDRSGVTALIGGTGTTQGGVMGKLSTVIENMMDPNKGAIEVAKTGFDKRAKSVEDGVAKAEERVSVYEQQLRKQFAAMDTQVAGYQSALSSLSIKA